MELSAFLANLSDQPASIQFEDTMAVIEANFDLAPTAFKNGNTYNEANQNNGSCKIFAFAQVTGLSPEATLACFGKFYREDVLGNPDGDDHANIRNFIEFGWDGIEFEGEALKVKA